MTLTSTYLENLVDQQFTTYSGHSILVYKYVSSAADIYQQGTRTFAAPVTVIGHYVRKCDEENPDGSGKVNKDGAYVVLSLPELRRKFPLADEWEWISTADVVSVFATQYTIVGVEFTGFMLGGTSKLLKLDLMEYPDTITLAGD